MRLMARVVAGRPSPTLLLVLLQLAKGHRFAGALGAGPRYELGADTTGSHLLTRIGEATALLETSEAEPAPGRPDALLDEETLLGSYAGPGMAASGATPAERLANLQHAYDAHLTETLLRQSGDASFLREEDVRGSLPPRTVLVLLYLGGTPEGEVGVYTLGFTREEVRVSLTPVSELEVVVEPEEAGPTRLRSTPLTVHVADVRRLVTEVPLGRRPVTREAERLLADGEAAFIGDAVSRWLEEQRAAGRDHLCLVPHGPLHFHPLHLLGAPGDSLAERWTVSYLPNLALLAPKADLQKESRQPVAAIGLGFESGHPELPPLRHSEAEAEEIADLYEVDALVGSAATEAAVSRALQDARAAHISTHGRHNVVAPAFQCLYLTPDAGSDGRLSAHEILGLDLRALDLVTLSACETALGRFDAADNLRGLPASFLLGGVGALVGTLWKVEDGVAHDFFVRMYRELRHGASKISAFAEAQRSVRRSYPRYRDWGAFYYAGRWEEQDDHPFGRADRP